MVYRLYNVSRNFTFTLYRLLFQRNENEQVLILLRYTLLAGKPPFETNSLKETYERIKRCDYRLPSIMKPTAAKLINAMLQPDPKRRPTVKQILNSEFFSGITLQHFCHQHFR